MKRDKEIAKSSNNKEMEKKTMMELERIAMDRKYIHHFPNNQKYISLFSDGLIRAKYDAKTIRKRDLIWKQIENDTGVTFKDFGSLSYFEDTYVDKENRNDKSKLRNNKMKFVDDSISSKTNSFKEEEDEDDDKDIEVEDIITTSTDSRFDTKSLLSSNIIEHADMIDKTLDDEENEGDRVGSNIEQNKDISNDNEMKKNDRNGNGSSDNDNDSDDDDDSTSSSDSESSSGSSSSDSDSDSDSSSDSDSDIKDNTHENEQKNNRTGKNKAKMTISAPISKQSHDESDSEDDFFVTDDGNDDMNNMFEEAKPLSSHDINAKGDKSKGWQTQKQLPGEFKKRRRRH